MGDKKAGVPFAPAELRELYQRAQRLENDADLLVVVATTELGSESLAPALRERAVEAFDAVTAAAEALRCLYVAALEHLGDAGDVVPQAKAAIGFDAGREE